ncbi:MAG TPA: hypothetical protein VLF67_03025 [Candidatus Saccharimonas sp.]|nr:hypothetical protein [Candidatus Saccharimonas sp.]
MSTRSRRRLILRLQKYKWVVIVAAVVLLTASVVAAGSYRGKPVAKATPSPSATAKPTPTPSPTAAVVVATPTPTPTPTPAQSYTSVGTYVMTTLGFQFPIPAELSGLQGSYETTGLGASSRTRLDFTTKSLIAAAGPSGGCELANDPLATVLVLATKSTNEGETDSQDGALLASPAGKYIYWHHPQSACSGVQAAMDLQGKQIDALKWALQHAEAIPAN